MRKIFLRATIAAAAILPMFFFITAWASHNHHSDEETRNLLICSALSPFAAFGAYFLVLWILEGNRRPKTRLKA